MTTFIASYDPEAQIGTVYDAEREHEIVFGLVNGNEWLPIISYLSGQPRELPDCFTPAKEVTAALTLARVEGHSNTVTLT